MEINDEPTPDFDAPGVEKTEVLNASVKPVTPQQDREQAAISAAPSDLSIDQSLT